MDFTDIYKKELDSLLKMVDESSSALMKISYIQDGFGYLFDFGQKHFNTYKNIVDVNLERAGSTIESIFIQMLSRAKKSFFYMPIDERYIGVQGAERTRVFQIFTIENHLRVGYAFKHYDEVEYKRIHDKIPNIDKLRIILMEDPDKTAYECSIIRRNNNSYNIEYLTLKELFKLHFSIEEYEKLESYIRDFNEKAKKAVKFQTAIIPSEDIIESFKNNEVKKLITSTEMYKTVDHVYDFSEFESINQKYFEEERYLLLLGNDDFAISFISSEWYYSLDQFSDYLDGTIIVAGYLKSIEQLLYKLISKHLDSGLEIKKKNSNKKTSFSSETVSEIDTTLCSLEDFIARNGSVLDVSPKTKSLITGYISNWRKNERNGYFHKDIIKSKDTIDEIRRDTLFLYFLILGSFNL